MIYGCLIRPSSSSSYFTMVSILADLGVIFMHGPDC